MEIPVRHTAPNGGERGRELALPELSVRANRLLTATRITVDGILSIDTAHLLHDLAIDCLAPDMPLYIDLGHTRFDDTSGVAVLLHIYAVARKKECVLVILNPVPSASRIINLLHLETVLPVSRDAMH